MLAAIDVLGRTGAEGFEFGHLRDDVPIAEAQWWAGVRYRGTRVHVENHVGPVEAAEALVMEVVHGAMCQGCGKLAALNDGPIRIPSTLLDGTPVDEDEVRRRGACFWERNGARWERGCGDDAPAGSTREKLARAMAEAGCPGAGIRKARAGDYDDYLSDDPHAINTLVADLEKNGFHELAARARAGEFDGTREESEEWARSDEGRAAHAEFGHLIAAAFAGAAKGNGKTTATKEPPARSDGRPPWRAKRRGAGKKKRS